MSTDFHKLAVSGIQNLKPYLPGKPIEELERELGVSNTLKLASNENTMGPSPLAVKAMEKAITQVDLYPDGNGFVLKQKLSEKLNVDTSKIILGNGSNDILDMIARTFLCEGREAIFSEYALSIVFSAINLSMYILKGFSCFDISLYNFGCVKRGSSPSL